MARHWVIVEPTEVELLAELDTACPDCECCGLDECDYGDCAGQFCPCLED